MNVRAKKVAGYLLLPQVLPRLYGLLGSGFSFIAFFVAQIFNTARLLPPHHPYLNSANMGRYGLRHVFFEAWRNIHFSWKNIDQILIFGLIVTGIFILAFQVVMLVLAVLSIGSALAMPAYFSTMFETTNPDDDIAFILLDRLFGFDTTFSNPPFFNSCVAQGIACFAGTQYNPQNLVVDTYWPNAFHGALREFISVYNWGLVVVGMLILGYLIASIVAETAESGTPFGKRFNHVWAPLRLVVAFGLLVPMASGLNSSQYIVLYAAKWGSGFATNGWNMFVNDAVPAASTILGDPDSLVSSPNPAQLNSLLEFATVLSACIRSEKFLFDRDIKGYMINPFGISAATMRIDLDTAPTYDDGLTLNNTGDFYYVFGEYKTDSGGNPLHKDYPGQVKPYCGEIVLQITSVEDAYSPGSHAMLEYYHDFVVNEIWQESVTNGTFGIIGHRVLRKHMAGYPGHDPDLVPVFDNELLGIRDNYINDLETNVIPNAVLDQISAPAFLQMDMFGWASAGLWYNRIAELNGALIGAVNAAPMVRNFPLVMEHVKTERKKFDQDITGAERYLPKRADGRTIQFPRPGEEQQAESLYYAQKVWGQKTEVAKPTGNIFTDAIHAFLGTKGLYNLVKNENVHPLAQLVGVGKSLVESAIRNLGASAFAGLAGGLANIMGLQMAGNIAGLASSIASKVAFAGLTAGFLLFYVVPFMPFIYFFFAVGVWVKTILEAMVGAPLWALAHLRIDGNGLPGDAALNGYYLVLEVFLRPILIVFGLLASVAIFGAQVRVLHDLWPLVTSNLTGFDANIAAPPAADKLGGVNFFRGFIDQLVFTLIYAFVVYMMAMASFKLVDMVPDYIMRWLGSAAPTTFGDIVKDDVEQMPIRAVIGVGGGIGSIMSAGGQLGNAAKSLGQMGKGP